MVGTKVASFPMLTTIVACQVGCASTGAVRLSEVEQALLMPGYQRNEALANMDRKHIVFVSFRRGAPIQLLPGCQVRGPYTFRPTPAFDDIYALHNGAWLDTNFPQLSSSTQKTEEIRLKVTTVGVYQNEFESPSVAQLKDDDCYEATHYVVEASIGAVSFDGLDAAQRKLVVGGRIISLTEEQEREIHVRGGDPEKCRQTTGTKAPEGCANVVKLTLARINGRSPDHTPTAPIVLMSAGGASLVASGILGLLASSKLSSLKSSCSPNCTVDQQSTYKTLKTGAFVTLGTGVGLLGAGALWWSQAW